MERKTITTLGKLRIGDRFVFSSGQDKVYQVTQIPGGSKVYYNVVIDGVPQQRYDECKSKLAPVLFLRHTQPEPGDQCFIEDLKPGDVFLYSGNAVTEYTMLETGVAYYKVRPVYLSAGFEYAGRLATVVFVRKGKKEDVYETNH